MILVFTNKNDAHPNPVFDYLTEWGMPFFRLNTEDLLTDYSFSWWADNKGCDFEIRNTVSGQTVKGSEIKSVWDRRPLTPVSLPIENAENINRHNLKEALGFLRFIRYYLEDIPSIGSIVGDRVAESKMLQYRTALDCGFKIPDTVFCNNKEGVIGLGKRHYTLCLKAIEGTDIWDEENGNDYIFYTQKIKSAELPGIPEEAFTQTVSFVQEYIPKDFELRVTVVGDDVFATKIHTRRLPDDKGGTDWRQGYDYGLDLEFFPLTEDIRNKCVTLVHALGLNFGCIDLIARYDGEFVFLECNPNGQWLWIELATGQRISRSIAEFLASPAL